MADLRRSIGLIPLVSLGAAGMVGNSWIYTNGEFFDLYGAGGEIFGLVLAGVLAAWIAIAYGELASTFPRAGGEVVYAYAAFNRGTSFIAGWLLIGGYVSSLAFYVTAFGAMLAEYVPAIESIPLYTINDSTIYLPVLLVGILAALVIFALNYFGLSLGAQLQVMIFAVMLLLGLVLVVAGFGFGSPDNFLPPFAPDGNPAGQTVRFILPGMTFFSGFGLVAILAEDVKLSPSRMGKAVVTAVGVTAGFYVLVLLASAWVIPWEKTATLPNGTIDAFRVAGMPLLGGFARIVAILGLVTSFLSLFIATSRIVLALSRVGLLPQRLSWLHPRYRTPVRGLMLTLVLTLALGLLGSGAITWFLDTAGIYLGLAWALGVWCMYRMPRRYPGIERAYVSRVRWAPFVGGVGAVLVIGFALWPGTDLSLVWPEEYVILVAWLLVGLVLYLVTPRHSDDSALRTMLGQYYSKIHGSASSSAGES